ncbi:MAG: hypothetical protein ACFFAX_02955 [Promethearchaeota archaeon]
MPDDKSEAALESIEKKIDKVTDELASVKNELAELSSVKGIDKKIDTMSSDLVEVRDSKEMEVLFKKMDDILVGLSDLSNEVSNSSTADDVVKKIEEMAGSLEGEVITKKIDELQQYVAGLSGLEDTVQEVSGSLTETKEIVGIIVRQLDDIERKYNQAIDRIEEALETLTSLPASESGEPAEKSAKRPTKKTVKEKAEEEKEEKEEKEPTPKKVSMSTIDEIMKGLLKEVTPQTEAREMARVLEETRDKLTTMISGHTPVLFQFGKKARELKSYPPTATLNENDIANLNTEIRNWATKLKEMAKTS